MDKAEYKLLNKNTLSKRTLNRQVGIVSHAGHMPYYNLRNIYMFLEKSFRHCDYYDLLSPENLYKILVKMAPWLPREGDPVFLVLVFLILTSDNPFTRAASEGRTINPLTLAIAKRELESLEVIARTGAKRVFDIFSMTKACQPLEFDGISVCDEPCERTPLPEFQRMLDLFASPVAWGNHIPERTLASQVGLRSGDPPSGLQLRERQYLWLRLHPSLQYRHSPPVRFHRIRG